MIFRVSLYDVPSNIVSLHRIDGDLHCVVL